MSDISPAHLYLGVDQGSSSTKGVLLDETGAVVAEFVVPAPARYENDRIVEQDPEGILSSVVEVFLKAKQWASANSARIMAAGLAVQRSGVLAWRASDGTVLNPMITWADTRTYPIIQDLGKATERISEMTGLPTIANFAAGKIHLLQRAFLEPHIKVGTLDSFLIYRLGARQKFITEDTMAARTMLYALKDSSWNDRLCADFRVDKARLPKISPSLSHHATFDEIPITALLGDQQAAVLGHAKREGFALLNLGTIASLLMETGNRVMKKTGLMTSVLYSREVAGSETREIEYLIETTSPITGSVLMEAVRRGWCPDSGTMQALCLESLQANPDGVAIAYFIHHRPLPPFYPEGTPNVMVCKPGATVADRVRALVENVGNLIVRMIEEFAEKEALSATSEIFVSGGGADLDFLLQYISDVSGRTLHRLSMREATSIGVARAAQAGIEGGFVAHARQSEDVSASYRPTASARRRRYLMWQKLEHDLLHKTLPPQAEVED